VENAVGAGGPAQHRNILSENGQTQAHLECPLSAKSEEFDDRQKEKPGTLPGVLISNAKFLETMVQADAMTKGMLQTLL
jgi:hypothetical protein